MRRSLALPLGAAGLFLALTDLAIRGGAPDAALHQRILGVLDSSSFSTRPPSSAIC